MAGAGLAEGPRERQQGAGTLGSLSALLGPPFPFPEGVVLPLGGRAGGPSRGEAAAPAAPSAAVPRRREFLKY